MATTNPQLQPHTPPDADQPSDEDIFRDSLRDAIVLVTKLAPVCPNVEDLVGLMKLATENDGQLRLLMDKVIPLRLRK